MEKSIALFWFFPFFFSKYLYVTNFVRSESSFVVINRCISEKENLVIIICLWQCGFSLPKSSLYFLNRCQMRIGKGYQPGSGKPLWYVMGSQHDTASPLSLWCCLLSHYYMYFRQLFLASCNFVFSAGVIPFRWTIHENLDAFTPFKVEAGLTSKSLGIFVNNFFTVSLTEKQKYSSEMWGQSAGICM